MRRVQISASRANVFGTVLNVRKFGYEHFTCKGNSHLKFRIHLDRQIVSIILHSKKKKLIISKIPVEFYTYESIHMSGDAHQQKSQHSNRVHIATWRSHVQLKHEQAANDDDNRIVKSRVRYVYVLFPSLLWLSQSVDNSLFTFQTTTTLACSEN